MNVWLASFWMLISLACFSGRVPVSSIADSCFCISCTWRRWERFVLHTFDRFSCRAYASGQAFSWRDPWWANQISPLAELSYDSNHLWPKYVFPSSMASTASLTTFPCFQTFFSLRTTLPWAVPSVLMQLSSDVSYFWEKRFPNHVT